MVGSKEFGRLIMEAFFSHHHRIQASIMVQWRRFLFWDVTRRTLAVGYLCFVGTTCQSHLQMSSSPSRVPGTSECIVMQGMACVVIDS
jgi:hypothetical protein